MQAEREMLRAIVPRVGLSRAVGLQEGQGELRRRVAFAPDEIAGLVMRTVAVIPEEPVDDVIPGVDVVGPSMTVVLVRINAVVSLIVISPPWTP